LFYEGIRDFGHRNSNSVVVEDLKTFNMRQSAENPERTEPITCVLDPSTHKLSSRGRPYKMPIATRLLLLVALVCTLAMSRMMMYCR